MDWFFLSPHLDDVVLSCGGLIFDRVQSGDRVTIVTICAGDPPDLPLSPFAISLHARWVTGIDTMAVRRAEDMAACQHLGAEGIHLDIPDCIYRRHPETGEALITENDQLFQPLPLHEYSLAKHIATLIDKLIPRLAQIVCPLTLGGHIDHHLTRHAAELLKRPLLFYADYPYLVRDQLNLSEWILPNWREVHIPISATGLAAWIQAVTQHQSQISTFWGSQADMSSALTTYWSHGGGSTLWGNAQSSTC
jgi:LmbE family N-acetylglucosaminyl deacetylase